ncbi:MAG: hypothetical protein JZU72_03210 [Chlorobium phaeobacteroides]|jgi:hypothetical protein|nr:hypothetical protein [Chlorobium phaeobacteroides]
MNFFDRECQELTRKDVLFGLCDDQDGTKAYTDTENLSRWIASVQNNSKVELTFTAIDNCVIKCHEESGRGRCDGMLTSSEHICFVELKDQKGKWRTKAIDQLESTILFFRENHDPGVFRHKKAYACNKQHKPFQEIDQETRLRFFRSCGFHIDVQAQIIVV